LAYLVGGARFIGLGISYIGAYFIVIVFAAIKIKSIFKGKIIVKAKDCMELLAFSFPLTFVGLLSLASGQIDALILGWYKNAQEVGLFVITFNLSLVCSAFLSLINYIFAPVTANLHGQNDIKTLEEVVKTVTRWILMLSLPIYFIFIINANMILQIFGKEYSAGYYPLLLLCSAQLFYAVGGLSAVLLPMIGKSYFAFFNSFIFLFLNAIFDILLVPLYGMMGAALGFSASLFIISLITMLQIYFILKIHQFSLKLLLPIICMAAIFVIGYLNKGMIYSNILYVFMFSILGISIYIGIMMHFIQKNDKEILKYIMHGSIGKVKNALFHIK
jgi:O-antigen/teichoic acid export membrane protein